MLTFIIAVILLPIAVLCAALLLGVAATFWEAILGSLIIVGDVIYLFVQGKGITTAIGIVFAVGCVLIALGSSDAETR